MGENREARRVLLLLGINQLRAEDAPEIIACVFDFQQDLVVRRTQLGARYANFRLFYRLLRQQVDGMRQLQPDVHSLSRAKRKSREICVNHEPRRTLRRTGFIKDVVSLLRLNTKTRSRELQVDSRIKRPVCDLSDFRDGEAFGFEHHVQRRQAVVYVLHPALGGVVEFID